ncbi:SsrA-binding protein [Desulforamulus reducens MI-1]|uniref:SsrA-binding protein n=1 Tax=Desulforamulus reducens (strain ATCC BAA-1160 / DSM 100696 / MI-1) TaxID=349161 RepID=SSRP_DESRM|nr:SsrA-binding protein SmpB [Desulforamulus reducens]A4J8T4.1 RecName: Full=SsrA-binding protein; AltName: Full=Small protein B [Desulforamulus reducens MI-1]ABO51487.1 SsrA-binding protein [Desulforamulus reducens MI-1]
MAAKATSEKGFKTITDNRRARHEYHVIETYEAGIALSGTEVKSLRAGKANLQDAFARVENGEMMLYNLHISPYEQGNRFNHEPKRTRRLLMHKQEILRLYGKVREKGLALIPLKVYFNPRGKVKVQLALAQGKKSYDKRHDIAARDAKRDMDRAMRERQKM